jgi:hypothetical protein
MSTLPGVFHRRVVVIPEPGVARGAIEDEMHHMEVSIFHDGTRVTDVTSATYRAPWAICPAAGEKLKDLIGVPLQRMNVSTGLDSKEHCTHLYDLGRIVMARAYLNAPVQYDGSVPDPIGERRSAELLRDGKLVLAWDLSGFTVRAPDLFKNHDTMGPPRWPNPLDDDTIEAALVLRRTVFVARSRDFEAERAAKGGATEDDIRHEIKGRGLVGHCFTFQLPRFDETSRQNSRKDYSGRQEDLLVNFAGTRSIADMTR